MYVIDTSDNVSAHLSGLKAKGVVAIGRYYSSSAWKRITRQEAAAISRAGIRIFVVFENDGDPELTADNGIHHAQIAAKQARDIGQPEGSAIYFALEHLPGGYRKRHVDGIKDYIGGVRDGLAGRYRIGVYSDGVVCEGLLAAGLCDYTWLSASLSFEGSRDFLASRRWSLAQDPHVDQDWDGLSVDLNQAKAEFGAFVTSAVAPTGLATAEAMPAGAGGNVAAASDDGDPAAPAGSDEINETADFNQARSFANAGKWSALDDLAESLEPPGATTESAAPRFGLDIARAKAFLEACRTSHPRVTYGLGAKVPFFGAVPGRDFTKVDCSGFVREAIRLSTTPRVPFPDGSVVQHDWVRDHGFEKSTVAQGGSHDGVVRIAFLRPQDVASGIGHVVLIHNGRTLESHGGVGPDARDWTGSSWQARTYVYILYRPAQHSVLGGASLESAALAAPSFAVKHGRRYRATVTLTGFERLAGNKAVAGEFAKYGFIDVVVTGAGGKRQAEGTWDGADTAAPPDPHLSDIVEIPAGDAEASLPAPAVLRGAREGAAGNVTPNVFSSESLPTHHDGLLVVKMRPEAMMGAGMAAAMTEAAFTSPTSGLGALSFLERAGKIRRVVPLRPGDERSMAAAPMAAAAVLTFSPESAPAADASSGTSFIELEPGNDTRELQAALAADPGVISVSRVPIRYLAARSPRRAAAVPGGIGIAAVPPAASVSWNLRNIRWEQARARPGFRDADKISVAVLDSGVDAYHPDLKLDAYHWQHPDLSRPVSEKDIIGHGTHVSGTIGALINGPGSINGVCKCRLNVWKIFDDQPTYAPAANRFVYYVNPIMYRRALAALVDDPVDVVNLSIGGPGAPDATERLLFQQLIDAGVTICAAMGNERQYGSPTSYPAAIRGVIAVGATGLDDRVTVFSNSGNHIAVAAPGKAIWSTLPTYPGQTGFTAVFGFDGQPRQGKPLRREVNYDAWDGTSMATPHVSACAALLIAKGNAAGDKPTPQEIKQALMRSADKVPAMHGALFSADYGAGRVNLLKLLK